MCDLCSTPNRPFVSPSRVFAGPGASTNCADELAALGILPSHGEILTVVDSVVTSLGLDRALLTSLTTAGYAVRSGGGVDREPSPEVVRSLLPPAGTDISAVVAIGGGSALDAAKLVSAALVNDLELTVGLKPTDVIVPGPPIVAVPTTAGTGAESTAVAMLWHDNGKRMFVHPHLVPRVVLLDPDLLADLPKSVTAAGGFDAIGHAIESMLSTFRTPLTAAAAREALTLLSWALPSAYSEGGPDARYGTALGAYQAGLALNASVVLGHSLAYAIASRTGLPHGVTVAMALPYCLAHARPSSEETIAEIAEIICGKRDPDALLDWLVEQSSRMGIPSSLAGLGVSEDDIESIATDCVENYPRPNHPVPIDVPGVVAILRHLHAGEPLLAWQAAATSPNK